MALVLKANGDIVPLCMNPSLKQMQDAVGGYIELVRIHDGQHMYVNEDGKRMNLPLNDNASLLAGTPIVGDAVVFDRQEASATLDSEDEITMFDPYTSTSITIDVHEKGAIEYAAKTLAGALGVNILQEEE